MNINTENPEVVAGLSDADWQAMEREAGSVVLRYLRTDDPQLEKRVKVATTVLSSSTRRQATTGARDALNYAISRSIARSPEELEEYVRLTQPSFPGLARHGKATQGKAISDGEAA